MVQKYINGMRGGVEVGVGVSIHCMKSLFLGTGSMFCHMGSAMDLLTRHAPWIIFFKFRHFLSSSDAHAFLALTTCKSLNLLIHPIHWLTKLLEIIYKK